MQGQGATPSSSTMTTPIRARLPAPRFLGGAVARAISLGRAVSTDPSIT